MQKYRWVMKKNIKKHSNQPRELSGLPPQDHPESIEIHENDEFLTENQTPPDCSPVVPGHSGGVRARKRPLQCRTARLLDYQRPAGASGRPGVAVVRVRAGVAARGHVSLFFMS